MATTQVPKIEKRFIELPAVEIRAEKDSPPVFYGYAAKFNSRSELIMGYFYEQIAKGAFADTITNDDIRCLIDHNPTLVLGRNRSKTLRMREDDSGLYIECTMPDTTYARDLQATVARGDVSGMSFAFVTEEDAWEYNKDETPLRTLKRVGLQDVSIVTYPAYAATEVDVRSYERFKEIAPVRSVDMAARQLAWRERL
jgi:HK97 family phage prohead protease